jgi:hypothetical protein
MEGFKTSTKMQCFKEGGAVKYKSRHSEKSEMSQDIKQDKAVVKKAFKMHDAQEHKGEHTNLSKLKKGGRAKKEVGTVKKYKTGGMVENAYAAKKSSKDMKDIANTKRQKPAMLCGGKSVKKYAEGESVQSDPNDIGGDILRKIGKVPMVGKPLQKGATVLRDNVMGTPEQNRIARAQMQEMARKKAMAAAAAQGQSAPGIADAVQQAAPAAAPSAPVDQMGNVTGMKKGGKIKKMSEGKSSGPISPVAQEIIEGKRPPQATPGKMTPEERTASIAKAFGAGAKKMRTGGTCS